MKLLFLLDISILIEKITKEVYLDWYENMMLWRKFEDKLASNTTRIIKANDILKITQLWTLSCFCPPQRIGDDSKKSNTGTRKQ